MISSQMPKLFDVLTFSDMCVDLILSGADVTPQFGQVEKLIDDYNLELGGSSNLFACQCAKLGLRAAVLGRVGDDSFGHFILRRLQENGVDIRYVKIDPSCKTGLGVALCPPGDRAILTYAGTIDAVYPEDVTDEILASTRHVHHGSFYLHTHLVPAIPDLFLRAHRFGASTSLDTNWDPAGSWEGNLDRILPHTDVFMPNDQEALRIFQCLTRHTRSGQDASAGGPAFSEHALDEPGLSEAAQYFLRLGVQHVAIKAGKQGAAIHTSGQVLKGKARTVSGGDSIGAGDSFDAGFLAGWLRGFNLKKCLDIGLFCGSSVAAQIGGLTGQPMWAAALDYS